MKSIILGTDWWTDCDDAVALRIITRYIKRGELRLLGVVINACMEYSVASLSGFLAADGVEGVPIGIDLEATDFGGSPPYQKNLAEGLSSGLSNGDAEEAVALYRRLLSEADGQVEMIEIGYPQVLATLLTSPPDGVSDRSGAELVREKVSRLWVMAGKWDGDGERENNFCRNPRSRVAGKLLCELCPVTITVLGWETGFGVLTGGRLKENDHLRQVMSDHGSENGRHSWDPMLTLMAIIGDEERAGYRTVTGRASVDAETGANHFIPSSDGLHRYVIKARDDGYYRDMIDGIIE